MDMISQEKIAFPSFAALGARILADESVPLKRRKDADSALSSLAKGLGIDPEVLLADPAILRTALKDFTPAMAGLKAPNMRNNLSRTRFAMIQAGLITVPGRYSQALSACWQTLLAGFGEDAKSDYRILCRFGRHCGVIGVEPPEVDESISQKHLADLTERSLTQNPARKHRDTIVRWNRAVATQPGWPQQLLTVPDNRRTYALPWESVGAASLKLDLDAWLTWRAGKDLSKDQDAPLLPVSLALRKRQMHEYLSALVLRGEDPGQLTDLAAAVTPARVANGLGFFFERAGGKCVHGGQIGGVVLSIARHWAKLPTEEINAIRRVVKRVAKLPQGMTKKNRARLRAVDDERLEALGRLPGRIRDEIVSEARSARAKQRSPERMGRQNAARKLSAARAVARRLQTAVAMEILMMAPMRLKNLKDIQIGVQLLTDRHGVKTLVLAEEEVKNGMPLEIVLPESSSRLIAFYVSSHRPALATPGSLWLFPGRGSGAPKTAQGLRDQIKLCIAARCGLRFNPHLFRHLAAKIILDAHPGAYGLVQRVLGHESIKTVMDFYTGPETTAAFAHYNTLLLKLRGELPAIDAAASTKGKRKQTGRG